MLRWFAWLGSTRGRRSIEAGPLRCRLGVPPLAGDAIGTEHPAGPVGRTLLPFVTIVENASEHFLLRSKRSLPPDFFSPKHTTYGLRYPWRGAGSEEVGLFLIHEGPSHRPKCGAAEAERCRQ